MLNGNIYSFYLYVLVVALLRTGMALEEYDGISVLNSNNKRNFNEDIDKQPFTFVETLRRTFIEFEELFDNILDIVATNIPKIARDAEIFLSKLSNHSIDVLNNLSKKILNGDDDVVYKMFHNFQHQMDSVRLEFQNLATSVEEHFNWAAVQLNNTLINNTAEYDWWTARIKEKLRTVNDTKLYQEGCQAIDAFVMNSSKKLQNCCKITMTPIRSLCKSASSLITEALHTMVDAIDRMQNCLEDKNSYLDYMLPCINLAYDEITSLISRAAQITHEINNMLPMKIIYTRSCFAIVKVDMNVRRKDIEYNLFLNK